jgi:hypothetical protein
VPRLALATGEGRVVVRELPGAALTREVYAVVRAASVRRPSVAVVLAALATGAGSLPGARPVSAAVPHGKTPSAPRRSRRAERRMRRPRRRCGVPAARTRLPKPAKRPRGRQ